MTTATDFVFPIPLAWDAHDLAEQSRQHTTADRAKQSYLRTLAVYAVKYYLDCMGIASSYGDGINNPTLLQLGCGAEVCLSELGSLECLPVLPGSSVVEVLPEVWSDRLAYVAVQLDSSLQTASIVGYLETVCTEQVPLEKFRQNSLEDLLIFLDRQQQTQIQQQVVNHAPIKLSAWFHNTFQQHWQNLNTILTPTQLAYRHRLSSAMGRKIFDLKRADQQVELSLGLTPLDTSELDVWVGVHPVGGQTQLPEDLQLVILNASGEPVMQAQANNTESLQFQFSGELGEQFSVCMILGDVSVTEAFVI